MTLQTEHELFKLSHQFPYSMEGSFMRVHRAQMPNYCSTYLPDNFRGNLPTRSLRRWKIAPPATQKDHRQSHWCYYHFKFYSWTVSSLNFLTPWTATVLHSLNANSCASNDVSFNSLRLPFSLSFRHWSWWSMSLSDGHSSSHISHGKAMKQVTKASKEK